MLIHEEQQNVEQFCELADFIDSGFQSFREQVRHLPPGKSAEAAFFAGAGLAMKLMAYFEEAAERYPENAANYLAGLVVEEINVYMEHNGMKLEWEPHVPSAWQQ